MHRVFIAHVHEVQSHNDDIRHLSDYAVKLLQNYLHCTTIVSFFRCIDMSSVHLSLSLKSSFVVINIWFLMMVWVRLLRFKFMLIGPLLPKTRNRDRRKIQSALFCLGYLRITSSRQLLCSLHFDCLHTEDFKGTRNMLFLFVLPYENFCLILSI